MIYKHAWGHINTRYVWMEAIQILFSQLKTDGDSFEKKAGRIKQMHYIILYNAFLFAWQWKNREQK